jgi:hypothetical protein
LSPINNAEEKRQEVINVEKNMPAEEVEEQEIYIQVISDDSQLLDHDVIGNN